MEEKKIVVIENGNRTEHTATEIKEMQRDKRVRLKETEGAYIKITKDTGG